MILAGLPFATLAAIFGAVGGGVVVALHPEAAAAVGRRARSRRSGSASCATRRRRASSRSSSGSCRCSLQLALLALLVARARRSARGRVASSRGGTLVVLVDASASMQATDVSPNRLGVAKDEVKSMIRGLGGADRMLVAQMDADGDAARADERRHVGARARRSTRSTRPTRAPTSRARCASRPTCCAASTSAEIVVVSDGDLGEAIDASGPVHLGDAKLSYVQVGKGEPQRRRSPQFSVRRYPLDKSRYEVMLEVTNTGDRARGRRAAAPRRRQRSSTSPSCASSRASACRASTRTSRARAARSRRSIALARRHARRPARGRPRLRALARAAPREGARRHRRATRTSRRRCCSTSTSTSPRSRPPATRAVRAGAGGVRRRHLRRRDARRDAASANALYLDPRGPGSPVKVDRRAQAARLRPASTASTRSCASSRSTTSTSPAATSSRPSRATRSSARRDGGPASSWRAPAAATSSSRSASTCATATCRCASRGRSSLLNMHQLVHRRGRELPLELPDGRRLAHPGAGGVDAGDAQGAGRRDAARCPCTRAAPCSSGEQAGFYELSSGRPPERRPQSVTSFAANLLDATESAHRARRTHSSSTARPRAARRLPRRRAARDLDLPAPRRRPAHGPRVGDLPPADHGMNRAAPASVALGRVRWSALGRVGLLGSTFASSGTRGRRSRGSADGKDYELLSPRMLGLVAARRRTSSG